MASIIFLGTSAATPTKERNLSSVAIRLDNGHILLIDAGEDVQRRFESAKLKFNAPTVIMISHMHGDHIIGLPGLLFNFHLNNRTTPLTLIGPVGLAGYLKAHFDYTFLRAINYPLTLFEIEYMPNTPSGMVSIKYYPFLRDEYDCEKIPIHNRTVFSTKNYEIQAEWVQHTVPTLAYRFIESPLDGKFDPNKAREMKIPMGRLWKQMQQGKTIKLKDGRQINPITVGIVTEKRPGKIIVYSGDTIPCEELIKFAQNADVLICESTYAIEEESLAIEKKHMSSRYAAQVAKEANVKSLILTHFSSRYKDLTVIEQEAQSIFPNSYVAVDLLNYDINTGKIKTNQNEL